MKRQPICSSALQGVRQLYTDKQCSNRHESPRVGSQIDGLIPFRSCFLRFSLIHSVGLLGPIYVTGTLSRAGITAMNKQKKSFSHGASVLFWEGFFFFFKVPLRKGAGDRKNTSQWKQWQRLHKINTWGALKVKGWGQRRVKNPISDI